MLERVGLRDKADAYPRQLSGGQQQRVAIARALALRPGVILFDEPTSALDPELVGEVLTVIKDLAATGTTLIIVTHEIGFAREVADQVVFLDGGVVVEHGPPAQVLDHPATRVPGSSSAKCSEPSAAHKETLMPLTRRRSPRGSRRDRPPSTTLAACGGSGGDTAAAVAGGTDRGQRRRAVQRRREGDDDQRAGGRLDPGRAAAPDPGRGRAEHRPRRCCPPGSPPLAFVGTDHKTLTGSEPDLGRLVGGVLGLKVQLNNATWENLFVGIDSGRTDIGFSNITDTEQRKQKYDFASYRQDNLAFETLATSNWTFTGDYQALADRKVSVSRGTNQEKILLEWRSKLQAEGKDFAVKYYPDNNAVQLALESGKIDIYFGPNPGVAYQVAQSADSPSPKRSAGTFSGAGESLQGLIAATTKKDSGLVKPVADAINYLIQNGQYQQWLTAWNLANEAVKTSEVNPPGLPITNT